MNATGDTVLFTSAASDLISGDYNETTDVFVVQLAAPFVQKTLLQQGKLNLQFSTRAQRKYRVESAADVAAGPWSLVQELTATDSSTGVVVSRSQGLGNSTGSPWNHNGGDGAFHAYMLKMDSMSLLLRPPIRTIDLV